MSECKNCHDEYWVCEVHPDMVWGGTSAREDACHCGGAGMPCRICNPCDYDNPPRDPQALK